MIPIPWLLGGLLAYFVATNKRPSDLLASSEQPVAPPAEKKMGQGDWFSPSDQPKTANGADVSGIINTGLSVVGKLVDWFNPPKTTTSQGQAVSQGGNNGANNSASNGGIKFWA